MTVVNGGSIGAGGTGNLTEPTSLSVARFVFTLAPSFQPLAADLVSIDPGTGILLRPARTARPRRSIESRPRCGMSCWSLIAVACGTRTGRCPRRSPPLPVVSAQGVRLTLADGRELIDGMASWWCAIHGYRNPVIDEAVKDQLGRMAHVMFGGLTHENAIRLAERLTDWTGLDHVFFSDSG